MKLLRAFLNNHILANLTFALVFVLGVLSYSSMPREQDPYVNVRWISVVTTLPGAAAEDVERRVTEPFEEAIRRQISDIRFLSSTSREGSSILLVRFEDIDQITFDKHYGNLQREVLNVFTDQVPDEANDPIFTEVTSSTWFPVATVVVSGLGNDENLRRQARNVKKALELTEGVDRVQNVGMMEPELQVRFYPDRLVGLGISAADLADTVRAYFDDISAGDIDTASGQWLVRIEGAKEDPELLARMPVLTASGVVELGQLADIVRTIEEPVELVRYQGRPAVVFPLLKTVDANILELVERLTAYIDDRNKLSADTGVSLHLVDDQTIVTRDAIAVMQNNALIGLSLVLLVTWLFLGTRVSLLTSIGIPFTLCGTFIVLSIIGMSINTVVLLGIVIALGMLVDDAVVVVETMYRRLQAGEDGLDAAINALREVIAPVTTSVLTTIAAFLPLALLPGILGQFMKVIPITVTVALMVSLLEAYWMLPAHVVAASGGVTRDSRRQGRREAATHWIRMRYTQLLLKALRHYYITVLAVVLTLGAAAGTLLSGVVQIDFFKGDPIRVFYVDVEMPAGTSLQDTIDETTRIEQFVRKQIPADELRDTVAYAGQQITETEPLYGTNLGQITVTLLPTQSDGRDSLMVAASVEQALTTLSLAGKVSFQTLDGGPPVGAPVSLKVRGDRFEDILDATARFRGFLEQNDLYYNVRTDYRDGKPALVLKYDGDAIQRAGLNPVTVNRAIRLAIDGELVSTFQEEGEEVRVRVLTARSGAGYIDDVLRTTVTRPGGGEIVLQELMEAEATVSQWNIRHYDYKRAVTIEAEIDETRIDTVTANQQLLDFWSQIREEYPDIELDFSGELDDINESIGAIARLFVMGIGLIYLIIGTQFRSYFQPFMILSTVPLAFAGVVLGLAVTGNPLSLFTM
ncbi:MAG: efflux RND transporter permease subunit, partial [Gammaproteobacteria bacterium]|nr:efflux RND transporter permease subunit [Gammaproteobacteria bacterium]